MILTFHVLKINNFNKAFVRFHSSFKILFFGNDNFSLKSLEILHNNVGPKAIISHLEIVTSHKMKNNPVKSFGVNKNIKVHFWPYEPSIKQEFDLGVVVSFGHLIPEKLIQFFPWGVINVHASLLPKWRGAAPIIHALLNGEKETGVTIMQIKPKKFDIGNIVLQKNRAIDDNEVLPSLYDKLSDLGAKCLIDVISDLPNKLNNSHPQPHSGVSYAPRILPADAEIHWDKYTSDDIHNRYRGLYGLYDLRSTWHGQIIKFKNITKTANFSDLKYGSVSYDKNKKVLLISCCNNSQISVSKLLYSGKLMTAADFYNGYLNQIDKLKWYFGT